MTGLFALMRKEFSSLFAQPTAYVVLTAVAAVTALVFFDHLRIYNQILFLYSSTTMGGFSSDEIPDYINLWDTVFFPVMETLGMLLIGAVPLISMRVFAEERSRGTDELLVATGLTPTQIVLGKFAVTFGFVMLMMLVAFVYPATAIERGGLGLEHLGSVFMGLTLHGIALASLGLVCSAYTSSQLVAAVSAWALAFVLWDFAWVQPFVGEGLAGFLDAISLHLRYGSFAEGIVSLANVAYFAGVVLVSLAMARFSFDLRRVSG